MAFASVTFFSTGVALNFENRVVYYRERAAGYYPSFAYSLSILVAELPYVLFFTLVNVSIAYWIVSLNTAASGEAGGH